MGQGQSNTSDDTSGSAVDPTPAKTDYYELLGVERTATEDEIKKAYRRKALELHPDRNYGNVEHATTLFAEVQSAYEVLSDPQERAWYDSHRDVLLRGGEPGTGDGPAQEFSYNIRMTNAEEVLTLMLKFNGRLAYNDSPTGFYGGLQEFFRQLAHEEDVACQWEDEEPLDYPDFGSKDDDYEDVARPFYAAWTGFATKKSYSWKDKYRLSEAPDRRIRRLMEKENKKFREDAVQEFNDAVRSLVAFVRKRDVRVQNNQKSEAERQKALKEAAAAQAKRSRAERQAQFQQSNEPAVPDWAKSRTVDEHEGTFSSESEGEDHEFDCIVCAKTFKSEAQFHAHEKSKKHIKLLKQLKAEMRKEGKEFDLDIGTKREDGDQPDSFVDETQRKKRDEKILKDDIEDRSDDESTFIGSEAQISTNGTAGSVAHSSTATEALERASLTPETSDEEVVNDDYAPRSIVERRLGQSSSPEPNKLSSKLKKIGLNDNIATLSTSSLTSPLESDAESTTVLDQKLGKAKIKRAKKAAAANTGGVDSESTRDSGFKCAVCQNDFPSKTKLFNHIKEKGHGAPVASVKTGGTKGGKGKKR